MITCLLTFIHITCLWCGVPLALAGPTSEGRIHFVCVYIYIKSIGTCAHQAAKVSWNLCGKLTRLVFGLGCPRLPRACVWVVCVPRNLSYLALILPVVSTRVGFTFNFLLLMYQWHMCVGLGVANGSSWVGPGQIGLVSMWGLHSDIPHEPDSFIKQVIACEPAPATGQVGLTCVFCFGPWCLDSSSVH